MAKKVTGNIKGLAPSQIKKIQKLYTRRVGKNEIISLELARELHSVGESLRRRVGLLINRQGHIDEVFIGTKELLYLPDLGRYRLGKGRLRRLRFIYSDLSASETKVDIPKDIYTDLEKLRLDLVAGVKFINNKTLISYAYALPYKPGKKSTITEKTHEINQSNLDFNEFIEELEAEHSASISDIHDSTQTRALLIGVYSKRERNPESSMQELMALADTADVHVVDTIIQKREPDPRTLLGKGKIEEVVLHSLKLGADLLIFDTELKPSQWRAITNSTELKVIDRSMLILDIFARRASSSDGRAQVNLAQLKYNLPRLVEKDKGLSRLTGGIGGRGPGETKLEISRRRTRDRIRQLEKQIDHLKKQRSWRREKRRIHKVPQVALVGYTNAGKSTLFNALTKSSVYVENKMFATLDPNQRRLFIPNSADYKNNEVVLSDTVGFIRNLPEELINAFRATLEELKESSLLVHVMDASDKDLISHKDSVEKVIKDMGVSDIPYIYVLNKMDLVEPGSIDIDQAIEVSAIKKSGVKQLVNKIGEIIY